MLRRLVIEIPFLLFAVFLPFFGGGKHIDILGVSLSQEGLAAAWNIVAKATLGAAASIVMAATTQVPDILKAFDRLHFPRVITSITGFMIRYLDVVVGEFNRMRVALQSRGYRPHWFGQARALAAATGTLFVRSFERGERVYLAMQSRGYTGVMPRLEQGGAPALQWTGAAAVVALAAAAAVLGWVLR
jgi:cobalt/nickel transport system permease protein